MYLLGLLCVKQLGYLAVFTAAAGGIIPEDIRPKLFLSFTTLETGSDIVQLN